MLNTKENSEKLGRLQQKVGRTEAQWKRRNTVYGVIPINALTIEIDWIITARVFNLFQTIHAQLV